MSYPLQATLSIAAFAALGLALRILINRYWKGRRP